MEESNLILIKRCIEKANESIDDAEFNFKSERYSVTLNRIYYAIFYSVLALAYKNDFITSKHAQLKGWFNKKFIYEEKIFEEKLGQIYQKSFNERQESDYELLDVNQIEKEEIYKSLNDAKFFVSTIKKYLDLQ